MKLRPKTVKRDWKALHNGSDGEDNALLFNNQLQSNSKKKKRVTVRTPTRTTTSNLRERTATRKESRSEVKREESSGLFAVHARQSRTFKKYFGAVKAQLQQIRFHQTFLDTYDRDGWKSANREKMRPEKELALKRFKISNCKQKLKSLLQDLVEGKESQAERRLVLDVDGGVDAEQIMCSVCEKNESDDQNDILLCDHEGCHRAFHQSCCDPIVTKEEVEGTDDWFCRRCMTYLECLNEINEHFDTDFDSWESLFQGDLSQIRDGTGEAIGDIVLSRRGRKITKPALEARAAWDTHSFASDTDDENFEEEKISRLALEASSESSEESDEDSSVEESDESNSGNPQDNGEDGQNQETLILNYKRQRRKVDYKALNEQLSRETGMGYGDEDDTDYIDGRQDQLDLDATTKELL